MVGEKRIEVRHTGTAVVWVKGMPGMPQVVKFTGEDSYLYEKTIDPSLGWTITENWTDEYYREKVLAYIKCGIYQGDNRVGETETIVICDGKKMITFQSVPDSQFIKL
jgi:hypothetical protein